MRIAECGFYTPRSAFSYPYQAIIFDLLSALLNSWKLWNEIAGSDEIGLRWRKRYIQLTYAAGRYRPYEGIIGEAAAAEGIPEDRAARLIQSWAKLEPWPETEEVLDRLQQQAALAVVTNCAEELAGIALEKTRIHFTEVVTAERAGFYKPHPQAYCLALEELGVEPARARSDAGGSCFRLPQCPLRSSSEPIEKSEKRGNILVSQRSFTGKAQRKLLLFF